jgi:hypothetical protein
MSLVDGSLQMEEKTLERFGFKLPCKDCLVLNVNPDYVEQISLSKMHNSENLLHLPSITLCSKNKIDNLKKVKLLQKNKVKEKHKKVSSLVWIRDKSLVKQPLLLGQHEVLGVKKKIFSVKSPKKKKHKIQVQASLV